MYIPSFERNSSFLLIQDKGHVPRSKKTGDGMQKAGTVSSLG
jgi:hypothetical protein